MLVDGKGVGDVGAVVLRDRQLLAEAGMVVVALTVDATTGSVVAGPEIASRGFVYMKEADELMDEVKGAVREALAAREEPAAIDKELIGGHRAQRACAASSTSDSSGSPSCCPV